MAEYSDRVERNGTRYPTQDALGSTRVVTGSGQEVAGRYDYLPFGEELYEWRQGYGGSSVRQKFTGYGRDDEIGLDFAQARYYSYTQGRFTSPDPALLSVNGSNPQSWNRYAYVLNNPLLYADPSGLWELYAQDIYKTKTNADGSVTQVYDRTVMMARRTQADDDGATLAAQLGLKGKEAQTFAGKIGDSGDVPLSDTLLPDSVSDVFREVDRGLTEQKKWEDKHAGELDKLAAKKKYGPEDNDCSGTSCKIGLGKTSTK